MLEVGTVPVQPSEPVPPVAVHDVALVVLQVSELDCPTSIAAGVAVKLTTAAGGAIAVISTLDMLGKLVPPAPVHVRM
jgi:hypothetical protein